MRLHLDRARACLKSFDFRRLFLEELGWAKFKVNSFEVRVDDYVARIDAIAEQGGMVIYEATPIGDSDILPSHVRKAIDRQVTKRTFEHLIIFINRDRCQSVWLWVKRDQGKQIAPRETSFYSSQPGDALLQKLDGLFFDLDDLDDEGKVSIITVAQRIKNSFDIEKITRSFYGKYKAEHDQFVKTFIKGIENIDHRRWYASVLLNRLMFIYFIQKKGFLDGDTDYLANRLAASKKKGKDKFYQHFLSRLFFEGLALESKDRSKTTQEMLGNVPYLNGGLFLEHDIEKNNPHISVPDAAFERLFCFFKNYHWHLDDRPCRRDDEINPDVLGYIFEKYINQKQMGAYYTKEDITGYICRNTIIPSLFDKLEKSHSVAVNPLPISEIEPYIYDAIRQEDRLPTESSGEFERRMRRLIDIRSNFKCGKITQIKDFITYNLDITAYAYDFLRNLKDPSVLRTFYFECLKPFSILDPTCGSGAFLFAALNILEDLYEICLDKMEIFAADFNDREFGDEMKRVAIHPNRRYFIYKRIIVGNLFGVDIMEEAVEICKLRFFLKLASEIDPDPTKDNLGVEPLPDIDFNICAGNTLVGYANLVDVENSMFGRTVLGRIKEVEVQVSGFRKNQTEAQISPFLLGKNKESIRKLLDEIDSKLDQSLFSEYGARDISKWKQSHQPFHWYVEFNNILRTKGFDVIVGNFPYVEYSDVRGSYTIQGYKTEKCGNLYAYVIERAFHLSSPESYIGQIIPMPAINTRRMDGLQELLRQSDRPLWISSYDERPSNLFTGVDQRLSIILMGRHLPKCEAPLIHTTGINRWGVIERPVLFKRIKYALLRTPVNYGGVAILKGQDELETSILKKFVLQKPITLLLAERPTNQSEKIAYRTAGGRYWKVFLDHPFETASLSNKVVDLKKGVDSKVLVAVMSSDLFWWYYSLHFDMYNLKDYMIFGFRFNYENGASDFVWVFSIDRNDNGMRKPLNTRGFE